MNVTHLSLKCLRELKQAIERAMNSNETPIDLPHVGMVDFSELHELLKAVKDRIAALEKPPSPLPKPSNDKDKGHER